MDINVALDGAKERNLVFYAGDDLSIVLKVYAHDGDITPIEVTNVRFDAPAGNLPLGSSFTVPYNYIGRSPYRIVGDVAGITTTLAYGVLQTPGGWPTACCWYEHGTLPAYPFGVVGKADNITLLDAGQNFTAPVSVEGALAELGEFKKQIGDGDAISQIAADAAQQAAAQVAELVDSVQGDIVGLAISVAESNALLLTVADETDQATTDAAAALEGLEGAAKKVELAAADSTIGFGFKRAESPAITRTVFDRLMDQASFRDFILDAAQDNWVKLQATIDALPAGAVLKVTPTLISDALYLSKGITLQSSGAGSVITQISWGKPHFIVDAAADVYFEGNFSLRYEGARTLISTLPTSTDSRISALYAGVGLSPGNPRTLSAGVYMRGKCDRLRADVLSIYGQVCGVMMGAANVYANYSADVRIQELNVDTVDFGFLSGGFQQLTIGTLNARNVTTTQGDPSHAIYVGPRTVRNGMLSIGVLNVDGCRHIADASDQLNASDAASIRGTELVTIGAIQVRNAQYLFNFQDGRFIIGSVNAVLDSLMSGTLTTELAVPVNVQSAADVTVSQWRVESALGWDVGRQSAFFINVSSDSKFDIGAGTTRMTAAKPASVGRISGAGKLLRARGMDVIYDADFDAAYPNPAAWVHQGTAGVGSLILDDPSITGTDKLFYAPGGGTLWRIYLNPSKIASNTPTSVIDNGGSYKVNFLSWPDAGAVVPSFAGTVGLQLRSRRVLAIANTAAAFIGSCHGGATPNQEYMLTCTDSVTTINNNATIVTKTGANVAPGWKQFRFRVIGGVAYEIDRL